MKGKFTTHSSKAAHWGTWLQAIVHRPGRINFTPSKQNAYFQVIRLLEQMVSRLSISCQHTQRAVQVFVMLSDHQWSHRDQKTWWHPWDSCNGWHCFWRIQNDWYWEDAWDSWKTFLNVFREDLCWWKSACLARMRLEVLFPVLKETKMFPEKIVFSPAGLHVQFLW